MRYLRPGMVSIQECMGIACLPFSLPQLVERIALLPQGRYPFGAGRDAM
jgi:hypothetical protein